MSNSPWTTSKKKSSIYTNSGSYSINLKLCQTASNNDWTFLHSLLLSAKVIIRNNGKSITYPSLVRTDILSPRFEHNEGPLPCYCIVQEELLSLYITLAKNKEHCLFLDSRSHLRIQKKTQVLEAKGCTHINLRIVVG